MNEQVYKSISPFNCKNRVFYLVNIRMINLSFDELRLIAQIRNISDYENKSKEDLIKALSEPKIEVNVKKKRLEKIRKDFDELRHKFSKKEIKEYRKAFYLAKNKYLSKSETTKTNKNLAKLKKSLRLKKISW